MTRVRLILVALLFCCSIRVEANNETAKPKCYRKLSDKGVISAPDGGDVKLTVYTDKARVLHKDDCFELVCEGSASPHRKITWYRLLNDSDDSSGLPIVQYWSEFHYYDTTTTSSNKNQSISSTLKIHNFNKGYEGMYYCRITNGAKSSVQSVITNLTLYEPPPIGSDEDPQIPEPLFVLNITAVKINDASTLVTWNTIQRNRNAKFCKIYQRGSTRKEAYTWTLQVLNWPYFNNLTSNPSYENITAQKYFSSYQNSYNMTLNKMQCNDKSYLLTNLSSTFYYKFQIMVEKHKREDNHVGKSLTKNGSYIHYFGQLTRPKIIYPSPHLEVCTPYDSNICKASGNPPPRVQLLQPVENNDNIYKCLAENIHLENSGKKTRHYEIVDFYWNIDACAPTETPTSPPQPSCVALRNSGVCNQYLSQGNMVYVPGGINITTLEERAQAAVEQLIKEDSDCYKQMVKFICYSYLAPCYMDTPVPRSVCPQSCDTLMVKCHNITFSRIKDDLPEWSTGRNCSKLRQTEAGSDVECIHLSVPPVEKENHTDGSCVVGKGTKYAGNFSDPECIAWDDHRQTYFDISIFTELKSAGSSCRNPGGSGERPWCYMNLSSTASTRWKYCDVPKCPSCERAPDVCRTVYHENTTVHIRENSYPVDFMQAKCFSNSEDRCHQVWNTIICHLAYPKCVKAEETDTVHSFMPLCRSYCNKVKNITSTCQIPSPCNQSYFVHEINDIDCSSLPEENCMYADLELEFPSIDPPQNLNDNTKDGSNHQLAISIYVAAAVCMFSVFTIVIIIIGYCCCLYGNESGESKIVKPLDNPLGYPIFANMKMNYINNPDYAKTCFEKDSTKSLRSISKSSIHYIRDLGSGNFGLVYQGKVEGLMDGEEFTMAAIKTLREGASAEGMKNFLHEAKLACQFDHENIIKLYGICMSEGFYCLVFEYMDLGDLNEFLRCSASSIQRRIMNPLDSSARSRTESSLSNNPPRLNSQQLVAICHQIALGMEYFAGLKHVHRDLATRNCLVGTGLVVKIGDFGMSQTLYHSDYYKQKGEQALPVRWMAPEAFIYGRFSTEGDVWAFGVVMWEVFSFAMQPYYGKMNDQVMNEVRRGHTLSRPDDCPESIFEIMRSCWQMEPHRRPTFSELVEELHTWKPTRCSTSTALESQGSTKGDMDSLSLSSIQDKDLELSVFDECNMSGTEEDIAN